MRFAIFVSCVLLNLTGGIAARAETIDELVQRRDQNVEFLLQLKRDVENYIDQAETANIANTEKLVEAFQEESVKKVGDDLRKAMEADRRIALKGQLLLRPRILRYLSIHPLVKVTFEGFSLGSDIAQLQEQAEIAEILGAQAAADLNRMQRVSNKIRELDAQIAELYMEQAAARLMLETPEVGDQSDARAVEPSVTPDSSDGEAADRLFDEDDMEGLDFSNYACSPEGMSKPVEIECPAMDVPLAPIGDDCPRCWIETGDAYFGDDDVADQPIQEDLGPLGGMDIEVAREAVSYCDENPNSIVCISSTSAIRLGYFCQGASPLADCAVPTRIGGLGGYCEGVKPASDCLPKN